MFTRPSQRIVLPIFEKTKHRIPATAKQIKATIKKNRQKPTSPFQKPILFTTLLNAYIILNSAKNAFDFAIILASSGTELSVCFAS
jgi:hypothetical protein